MPRTKKKTSNTHAKTASTQGRSNPVETRLRFQMGSFGLNALKEGGFMALPVDTVKDALEAVGLRIAADGDDAQAAPESPEPLNTAEITKLNNQIRTLQGQLQDKVDETAALEAELEQLQKERREADEAAATEGDAATTTATTPEKDLFGGSAIEQARQQSLEICKLLFEEEELGKLQNLPLNNILNSLLQRVRESVQPEGEGEEASAGTDGE